MPAPAPAPAIGLTKLPTELLEQILAEVFPYDGPRNKRDLLATMKTCRRLYAVGQERLYRAPLQICRSDGFGSLVATLQSNHKLALAVNDLATLSDEIQAHQIVSHYSTDQERQRVWHECFDLQLDCLRACTNVSNVSVLLSTRPDTPIIASLLAHNSRLRRLVLVFDYPPSAALQEGPGDLAAFKTCLEQIAAASALSQGPPRLTRLELVPEWHNCPTPCHLGATLRGLAAHLVLDVGTTHEPRMLRCSLEGLFDNDDNGDRHDDADNMDQLDARLDKLDIVDYDEDRSSGSVIDAYDELSQLLPGNCLTSFTFADGMPSQSSRDIDYINPDMPPVPASIRFFTLFPRVRHLCLADLWHMTLPRLLTLVKSSPNLITLKLLNGRWNLEPDDLIFVPPDQLSAFEVNVAETLETLKYIEKVDLGLWPYVVVPRGGCNDDSGRVGLQGRLAERGIQLSVHGCHT
ncbi:hypothetical protein BMF94_1898 [Rhodotorula taiwanensis]|uniref:F-box domain-containing protein n=1 Tax=Rhodotorula taiwanensis TaxID=741276 RepID=A0A2S5BDS0_9BASI|nr:hypothetical protein BMF94_1898 [Rhodotorula taiwanensis]